MSSNRDRKAPLILSLAVKDLRHEVILSLCLILAVTAVLGPILLLFGLKSGSISLLRNRLVEDPRNREIRPMTSARWEPDWFTQMQKEKGVAFVVPMTRQISTAVKVCVVRNGQCQGQAELDLLSTAAGDPLLLENGGGDLRDDSCALTAAAAQKLQAMPGDLLQLTVRRLLHGRRQKVQLQLRVDALLDARAGATKSLFVPLTVLEQVEQYKDGEAVPSRGWEGEQRNAWPLYDGLVVHLPAALSPLEEVKLRNGSGFSKVERLNREQLKARFHFEINTGGLLYLLSSKRPVREENVATVQHRLRGRGATFLPVVKPQRAELQSADGTGAVTLCGLPYDRETISKMGLTPLPRQGMIPTEGASLLQGFFPEAEGNEGASQTVSLHLQAGDNHLTLPLLLYGGIAGKELTLPIQLAGELRLLEQRPLHYNAVENSLTLSRRAYAGFRLYTTTIDEVEPLRQRLDTQGIAVSTQAERIRDVQELDRSLSLIFYVIAAAAAAGGAAALTASLYGAVERRRREIGILRLLGVNRTALLRFPVYQGLLLTAGGSLLALLFFVVLSALINHLFAGMVRAGESLCTLSLFHGALFAGVMTLLSVMASMGAAIRIIRLDPVEALRDE